MTGRELIEFIQNNCLEDYTFEVCHETGEASYPIRDFEIDYELKVCEVV